MQHMKGEISKVNRKKTIFAMICLLLFASLAHAWEKEGVIPTTELEFEGLDISKKGVGVKLTNTSHTPVKVSLKLTFFDERSNSIGYAIFGLREIKGDSYVNIAETHLNGNWKKCREAYRIEWRAMTYELIY